MGEYLKCDCSHCGQSIEYPAEGTGQIVPCPTCDKPITLTLGEPLQTSGETKSAERFALEKQRNQPSAQLASKETPPADNLSPFEECREQGPQVAALLAGPVKKRKRWQYATLTEETIRQTDSQGNTPLHRAAMTGRISEIPRHILSIELFLVRNNSFYGDTPIHAAAKSGQLDKVPKEFLTKETMTACDAYENGWHSQGRTPTPLERAIQYGHADQIPKEFIEPEFLGMATGAGSTILHDLAHIKRLDVVPEAYADSRMWNQRNSYGQTPSDIIEANKSRETFVARVRSEPATEKQKEKLRWFGYVFEEIISKGEASDAIDECIRQNPEKERQYYDRPATEEQMAQLREYAKTDKDLVERFEELEEEGSTLAYGEAKDLLRDCERDAQQREMDSFSNPPTESQIKQLEELGFKLDTKLEIIITQAEVEGILGLKGATPSDLDLQLFKQHGITSFQGDALSACVLGDLIRAFGGSAQDHNRRPLNYLAACQAAAKDPDFQNPKLTRDEDRIVAFSWPKSKINEWLRAAKCPTL